VTAIPSHNTFVLDTVLCEEFGKYGYSKLRRLQVDIYVASLHSLSSVQGVVDLTKIRANKMKHQMNR